MINKRFCIADCRLSQKCASRLEHLGYDIIFLPPFSRLASPVASHPDMLLFFNEGKIITYSEYYDSNTELIDRIARICKCGTVASEHTVAPTYPHDIGLNAFHISDRLVGNLPYLAPELSKGAKGAISVKQGYAKCSCAVIEDCVITSDNGIFNTLSNEGICCLKTDAGGVALDGYDCGFIGGASGYDASVGTLFFCGDIDAHPSGRQIRSFCNSKGVSVISLSDEPLYDYGTLFFI